jgi:hypothetical protein
MVRGVVMLLLAALASMAVGMGVSYYYWGYPTSPPPILPEISMLRSVDSMSYVDELDAQSGKATFKPIDQEILANRHDWSLDDTWRVPLMLHDRGIRLDQAQAISLQHASALWEAADRAGLLIEGSAGYPDTKTLFGHIGTGRLNDGREIAFATVGGYQYSNDHYPYYEFVAELRGGRAMIINSQWYYFDIAGIEGMTWVAPAVVCFVPLVFVGFLVFAFGGPRKEAATS